MLCSILLSLDTVPSERVCSMTVRDVKGSYTIPYIQSERDLTARLEWKGDAQSVAVVLRRTGQEPAKREAQRPADAVSFERLSTGEYDLEARWRNVTDAEIGRTMLRRIGVGTVLAAIGDSITEGYHGQGFWRDALNLKAEMFPSEAVSRDGRNFPQFSPTTATHKPNVNCFQSWMTGLNDGLADAWRQPVFIANEGWGGISSGAYLRLMQTDKGWQQRMRQLQPRIWLIHLGVNDERAKVPAKDFARGMDAIVELLVRAHGASPERVLIAKPCYDYAPGARDILSAYGEQIDALVTRRGLRLGPDFFAAYSTDKEKWYGADPVHPNVQGMDYMAGLWLEALVRAFPGGTSE